MALTVPNIHCSAQISMTIGVMSKTYPTYGTLSFIQENCQNPFYRQVRLSNLMPYHIYSANDAYCYHDQI